MPDFRCCANCAGLLSEREGDYDVCENCLEVLTNRKLPRWFRNDLEKGLKKGIEQSSEDESMPDSSEWSDEMDDRGTPNLTSQKSSKRSAVSSSRPTAEAWQRTMPATPSKRPRRSENDDVGVIKVEKDTSTP